MPEAAPTEAVTRAIQATTAGLPTGLEVTAVARVGMVEAEAMEGAAVAATSAFAPEP